MVIDIGTYNPAIWIRPLDGIINLFNSVIPLRKDTYNQSVAQMFL